MRLEHPIFHTPLEVEIELTPHATPKNYANYPGGESLPAELEVWQVQSGAFPQDLDVGLVSDPYGFGDSPDAEWISSGINSKGPFSVALGRHGNYFLWGFSGDPTQMTESGRRAFLNSVVYVSRFGGRPPLVTRVAPGRETGLLYAKLAEQHGQEADAKDWLPGLFPESVRQRTELDPKRLELYYRTNFGILRPAENGLEADPDLNAAQVPNNSEDFFVRMRQRLAADAEDEIALRLLDRYVGVAAVRTVAGLDAWLAETAGRRFFSDVGGYRWFVAPPQDSR